MMKGKRNEDWFFERTGTFVFPRIRGVEPDLMTESYRCYRYLYALDALI